MHTVDSERVGYHQSDVVDNPKLTMMWEDTILKKLISKCLLGRRYVLTSHRVMLVYPVGGIINGKEKKRPARIVKVPQ